MGKHVTNYTKIAPAIALLIGMVQTASVKLLINILVLVLVRIPQEILAEENMLVVLAIHPMHGRVLATVVFVQQNIHVPENMKPAESEVNAMVFMLNVLAKAVIIGKHLVELHVFVMVV